MNAPSTSVRQAVVESAADAAWMYFEPLLSLFAMIASLLSPPQLTFASYSARNEADMELFLSSLSRRALHVLALQDALTSQLATLAQEKQLKAFRRTLQLEARLLRAEIAMLAVSAQAIRARGGNSKRIQLDLDGVLSTDFNSVVRELEAMGVTVTVAGSKISVAERSGTEPATVDMSYSFMPDEPERTR